MYVENDISFESDAQLERYLSKLYIMEPLYVKTLVLQDAPPSITPSNVPHVVNQQTHREFIQIRRLGTQYNSQRELVSDCVSQLAAKIRDRIYDQHVLLMGFQRDEPNTRGVPMAGVFGVRWVMPNSAFEEVKKRPWERLLRVIGDGLMCHLLKNEQIFLKLKNGCLWQLTGVPVNKTMRERKKELYYSKANSTNTKYMYTVRMENREIARKRGNGQEWEVCTEGESCGTAPSGERRHHSTMQYSSESALFSSDEVDSVPTQTTASTNISDATPFFTPPDFSSPAPAFMPPYDTTLKNVDVTPIRPGEQQSPQVALHVFVSPSSTKMGGTHSGAMPTENLQVSSAEKSKKRKRVTLPDHHPSKVIITRRLIMFSPPVFISHGFPVTHILNKITSDSKTQAKVLYSHIFGKKRAPPTELNHVLDLLAQMKRNHMKMGDKIRFLVEKYCPVDGGISGDWKRGGGETGEKNNDDIASADCEKSIPQTTDPDTDPNDNHDDDNDEKLHLTEQLNNNQPNSGDTIYTSLIVQFSSYSQVSTFVHHALNKIVPVDFFGSAGNKRTLYGHISRFISLSLYDSFTLQEAVDSIKITECTWAFYNANPAHQKADQFVAATHRVAQFVQFIFTQLVVPLMRAYFYCTETNEHRAHIYYYRRDVWRKISSVSWEKLANADLYEKIPEEEVNNVLARNSFASAGLSRLLPKKSKIRAIVNLSRKYQNRTGRVVDTNTLLKTILHAMKFEFQREPSLLGSSVFSAIDIYNRFLPFVKLWKNTKIQGVDRPKLYWVSVDVTGSYDNIPHDKLFDVTKRIFHEDSYLLVRFYMLRPSLGSVSAKYACKACLPSDFPSSFASFFDEFLADKHKKTLFVDQVLKRFVSRDEILHMLGDHIHHNLVRMGSHHFRQSKGIPQGSVLSPLLCSHMYAHLERSCLAHLPGASAHRSQHTSHPAGHQREYHQHDRTSSVSSSLYPTPEWNYFPPTQDAESLPTLHDSSTNRDSHIGVLTRLIDDFLYVTTDKEAANSFLDSMRSGFNDYGIQINEDKTKLNFEPHTVSRFQQCTSELEWCGFLINTKNFEILKSYRKYMSNNISMFTSKRMFKPGIHFARKLKSKVSFILSPLLIDCTINSLLTAYINVYQCAMFVAMHFHIFRRIMQHERDNNDFLLKTLEDIVGYFWIIIRTRAAVVNRSNSSCVLCESATICVVLHAFQRVLQRKQTLYRGENGVLASLGMTLAREEKQIPGTQRGVYMEVIRDERCDEMMKISF